VCIADGWNDGVGGGKWDGIVCIVDRTDGMAGIEEGIGLWAVFGTGD